MNEGLRICARTYGGGTVKPAHFFEDYPTFAVANHQPPTLDDNNWVTRIDRESPF